MKNGLVLSNLLTWALKEGKTQELRLAVIQYDGCSNQWSGTTNYWSDAREDLGVLQDGIAGAVIEETRLIPREDFDTALEQWASASETKSLLARLVEMDTTYPYHWGLDLGGVEIGEISPDGTLTLHREGDATLEDASREMREEVV